MNRYERKYTNTTSVFTCKIMKLIYSNFIPFKGYYAMNLFGFLVRRKKYKNKPIDPITYNHESIHEAQAHDFGIGWFGYIIFYIWYFIEWLIRLIINPKHAYRDISFEQECYNNQYNLNYLKNRKRFSWIKYI